MEIYSNKEPIQILWDIMKGLMYDNNNKLLKDGITIYKETMHEEENDIPDSYILLRSQTSDSTDTYGDGVSLIRNADCDIILVSKGYAEDTTDLHNINKIKIKNHLKAQEIPYTDFNLGYDNGLKSTQHTFTIGVKYIG